LTRATYETAVELLTPATTMGNGRVRGRGARAKGDVLFRTCWTWATRRNLNQTDPRSGSKNLRKITEKFT